MPVRFSGVLETRLLTSLAFFAVCASSGCSYLENQFSSLSSSGTAEVVSGSTPSEETRIQSNAIVETRSTLSDQTSSTASPILAAARSSPNEVDATLTSSALGEAGLVQLSSIEGAALSAPLAKVAANPQNTIGLSSPLPLDFAPLQLGRVFRQGEIKGCPSVLLDGSPIQSQATVKNRWEDGSVKFAVLHTVVPSLGSTEKRLTFGDTSCPVVRPNSFAAVLAKHPQFDVSFSLNNGAAGTASLRAMASTIPAAIWADGPIATQFVIADHVTKRFDIGLDSFKSVRPVFHVTVWHSLNIMNVRVIGEQSDTEKMQNQQYSLSIAGGLASQQTLYFQAAVNQTYASRWTKSFWFGASIPELTVKHNVAYLASTKAIPNYDGTVTYNAGARQRMLQKWAAVPSAEKELYGAGLNYKYMPGSGGRPDIGLFTEWGIAALYDGDSRLWDLLKRNNDLQAAWPVHFREGSTTRNFMSFPNKAPGLGLPATRDGRTRMFLWDGNGYWGRFTVNKASEPIQVGPKDNNGWVPDCAHQPDDHYLLYLVTGDYWYLEQLHFWAAWGTFFTDVSYPPPGMVVEDAWFDTQIRGEAWCMRTRARAAWASPDGAAEKAYFSRITESALRVFEGQKIGANGRNSTRDWWAANQPRPVNSLNYWKVSPTPPAAGQKEDLAPWQVWFMTASLGHLAELGFGSQELLSWISKFPISFVSTASFDPEHLADYQFPVRNASDGSVYQSLVQVAQDMPTWKSTWVEYQGDLQHGYPSLASTAFSFVRTEPGGQVAWDWMYRNHYTKVSWDQNPKWAILPR